MRLGDVCETQYLCKIRFGERDEVSRVWVGMDSVRNEESNSYYSTLLNRL